MSLKKVGYCVSILAIYGCTSVDVQRNISSNIPKNPLGPAHTANEVYLYTSWFRGMFGDGKKEWDGVVSDNDLAVGLHPATHSEFDFKVRSYHSLSGLMSSRTNFLTEVAKEIYAENKINIDSSAFEILTLEQSYPTNGSLGVVRSRFTFLHQEGDTVAASQGVYQLSGPIHFVHYLADVRCDADTNYSGIVFHAMAFIPQQTNAREREHLIAVMKHFIQNMDLTREQNVSR
jgi:hypothetical protein